jgi:translation initiation factor IF-2
MTTSKEPEANTPLKLNRPGKLQLKKTVETGQVRQSFSHGRSKAVTVEVKRSRTFERGTSGRMTEVTEAAAEAEAALTEAPAPAAPQPEVEEKPARRLSAEERASRARALEVAREEEAARKEREAEEAKERAAQAKRDAEDHARREAEAAEERKRAAESAPASAEAAPGAEVAVPAETDAPASPRAPAKARPAKPAGTAVEDEDEESKARAKARKGVPVAPKAPPRSRGEPRRRAGKLTINQALDGQEGRQRSLAAMKRQREKQMRAAGGQQPHQPPQKVVREVVIPEALTVQELANRMAARGAEVVKSLMKMGVMVTINQSIDADTAELVVEEFGHKSKRVAAGDVEIGMRGADDRPDELQSRPPVVTIMGHVDHGKTSLLDALRETDVVAGEAGGITQHIGAYQVRLASDARITFIDTPGHAAFTEMRLRGATVTDIVVLVVAADDGIKEQTVEAINHAKAAQVPIIVAINKIDKPGADPARVKQELLQHELITEDLGGDILAIEVSATQKTNLDKLEEAILLQSELLELKANPLRPAEGVIIEAKLERGRGSVATVLVQRGTLKVGDIFVAGGEWGRVRALVNERDEQVDQAGPATPVEVLGLNGTPLAGDDFTVMENEGRAREIAEYRKHSRRETEIASTGRGTLEEMMSRIKEGEVSEFPVVVKSDVHGSMEAIVNSLNKLSTEEVKARVLHSGVGGINESDVTLANATGAMIIAFNVRANPQARQMARRDNVDIRYYSIIYNVVDDVKAAMSGLLAPKQQENFLGYAEIREVFSNSKVGKVAGCMVTEGLVKRGAKVRLLRDNVVIHDGTLKTLRRFKDEVREVKDGYECGMAFENYTDIQVGDQIECYEIEEVAREL